MIAHSPLGGPVRARRLLTRESALAEVAQRHGVGTAAVALAWLLDLAPHLVVIPGARRPDAVRSAAVAARLVLDDEDRAVLARRFGRDDGAPPSVQHHGDAEVVVLMGIPGAGKSRAASSLLDRGYRRLNRDAQGGMLRELAEDLDAALGAGGPRSSSTTLT